MKLRLKNIIVVVGHCGSGKTEFSVNLALDQIDMGFKVKIADLDLVNPYFRAREVRKLLFNRGVKVILPSEKYIYADLPILTPIVSGVIKSNSDLLILDVGGGAIGSTVLGALSCFFKDKNIQMLYVVNPKRPYNDTIENCLKIGNEIEAAAKIKISGIIGNTNLMDETRIDDIYDGYDFVLKLSKKMNIPLFCITVPAKKLFNLKRDKLKCSILPIWRKLVPPWLHPEITKR